ncbi:hypothetical protein BJ170DRAFT_703922 [Xylariales sp. AK1849]|nr:hypothetical protein BJ170DRAFT_703922 [Xylariales sp. AK1849]
MDIRGKVHNPENQDLAVGLCNLCDETLCLQLPDASKLQAPVRSNISARRLTEGSLTRELHSVLVEVAKDLRVSANDAPKILQFKLADTISPPPFIKQGLRLVKTAAYPLIPRISKTPAKDVLDFPDEAIAVIGASCRLPSANNLEELWELLAFCVSDSSRVSQSASLGKERRFYGNFIDNVQRFDNSFFGRILLEVAYEALDEAGYLARHHREDGDNVGCFVGGSFVEYLDNTNAHALTAYTSTGTIRAFLCGRLSYYFGWSGPLEVLDIACSSSLVAINRACKVIQIGECYMALAGGINIITGINNNLDLAKAGFLSPTGQCKPFDISADGYCRSDGAGLVVLKKLSRAVADGDVIMGVIPGIATNHGGLSASITVPSTAGQQSLYQQVLRQAQIPPESVIYVEAYGTGTQAGDPLEIESLRAIFGKGGLATSPDRILYVGLVKGNLGHYEIAAGVYGQIPPQANHKTLNPKIASLEPDGLSITRHLRDWDAPFRAALVNSYGAAGSNCALVCCQMPSKSSYLKNIDMKAPLLISAASEKSLLQNARALSAHLRISSPGLSLGDYDNTMGLNRVFYEKLPAFRFYLDIFIGHSLGELTALAVSRVLSLTDAIKLIAGRAHLIDTKWGPEKDSMLRTGNTVEIACYNAASSVVAAGISTAIDGLDEIMRTEPIYQNIRTRRLPTTHGFHSSLSEPLLADLTAVYIREPVFFGDAIQRLEKRFGSAVWLEAGINTPAAPMARAASGSGTSSALNALAGLVSDLWKRGHFVNHWQLISPSGEALACKQCWLSNVDRVTEMQQIVSKSAAGATVSVKSLDTSLLLPPKLVSGEPRMSKKVNGQIEFTINSVTMALQLLTADGAPPRMALGFFNLEFQELSFHAPLGTTVAGEVVVRLTPSGVAHSWNFVVCTLPDVVVASRGARETVHGKGVISLVERLPLDAWQRLVSDPMDSVEQSGENDTERLMPKSTYSLFSLVVDYVPSFLGIQFMVRRKREALATIRMPEDQPAGDGSTAWTVYDIVTLDLFVQVLGFIINTSDFVALDEVAVMVGLDRAMILSKCDFSITSAIIRGDWRPIGDVFVYSIVDNSLVAVLTGCRFAKLSISKLEKSLDQAMRFATQVSKQPNAPITRSKAHCLSDKDVLTSDSSSFTKSHNADDPSTSVASSEQQSVGRFKVLKHLIAECTGVAPSDIPKGETLSNLGLDSLAAAELVGELSSKFNLSITSDDLIQITLDDLSTKLMDSTYTPATSVSRPASPPITVAKASPRAAGYPDEQRLQKFKQVFVDVTSTELNDVQPGAVLADLGIDSMSAIVLKQELEDNFSTRLQNILVDDTVEGLMKQLGTGVSSVGAGSYVSQQSTAAVLLDDSEERESNAETTVMLGNPFKALKSSDAHFDTWAKRRGFLNYWKTVGPCQDAILLAYITEGFAALGVDLTSAASGSKLLEVTHLTQKYDKLIARLWEILKLHGLVSVHSSGTLIRGDVALDKRSSTQLLADFRIKFQDYRHESDLMEMTGPALAGCLSGKVDPVSLMFGNPAAMRIMEIYYGWSPMISTMTDQLIVFLTMLFQDVDSSRPVRILEVGAGTGGTTKRVLDALALANISVDYTFTDIAASLVAKAKTILKDYRNVEYSVLNLEKDVSESFRGRFDVVIGTNCVQATDALVPGGVVVLSEVTRVVDWYDICFGLLDGWWLAEGRTIYPIQPAEHWMSVFDTAGLASHSHSGGFTPESTSQQLLVACNEHWDVPSV